MNHSIGFYPRQVDEGGIVIEAETFGENYGSGHERVPCYSTVVSYNKGQWVEYSVEVPQNGEYEVIINAGTKTDSFIFKTSVNGASYKTMSAFPSTGGVSVYESHSIGMISLNKGNNTLRLLNSGGGMHFDYFVLKYVE